MSSAPEIPDGHAWTSYYYAGGSRVAMRVQSNQEGVVEGVYYFLSDHLGSTAITLDAGADKVAELRYSAWGETRYTDGTTPTQRRYTGQIEAEAGLYFYQARWFDPSLGRFAQADTVIPGAGNALAWDRYAGMANNPVRYNDPTGHCFSGGLDTIFCRFLVEFVVGAFADDISDGSFDMLNDAAYTVDTTKQVLTGNPFGDYRNQELRGILGNAQDNKPPDVTDWLISTMNFNANGPIGDTLRAANSSGPAEKYGGYLAFTALVKGRGPWDYKRDFNDYGVAKVILSEKYLVSMENIANINYGYAGRAAGYSPTELYIGAGAAQLFDNGFNGGPIQCGFDECADRNAINFGIWLYENNRNRRGGLSREQFDFGMRWFGGLLKE